MVGRSRFGGIYSILSQRDLNTIRSVEGYFETAEHFRSSLADQIIFSGFGDRKHIEDMTLDEIVEGLETYIGYFQEIRGVGIFADSDTYSEMMEDMEDWSTESRVWWADTQGQSRYWEGQLSPILGKLKRYQNRLQNEELN